MWGRMEQEKERKEERKDEEILEETKGVRDGRDDVGSPPSPAALHPRCLPPCLAHCGGQCTAARTAWGHTCGHHPRGTCAWWQLTFRWSSTRWQLIFGCFSARWRLSTRCTCDSQQWVACRRLSRGPVSLHPHLLCAAPCEAVPEPGLRQQCPARLYAQQWDLHQDHVQGRWSHARGALPPEDGTPTATLRQVPPPLQVAALRHQGVGSSVSCPQDGGMRRTQWHKPTIYGGDSPPTEMSIYLM